MKVVITAAAQQQASAERRWWRDNRDAKNLFTDELRAARQVLSHAPKLEVYAAGMFEKT